MIDYLLRKTIAAHPDVAFILKPSTSGATTRSRAKAATEEPLIESNAFFADDAAILAGGIRSLQDTVAEIEKFLRYFQTEAELVELKFNVPKCDVLAATNGKLVKPGTELLEVNNGNRLKTVGDFKYLGSFLVNEASDIKARSGQARTACKSVRQFWRNPAVSRRIKATIFRSICVTMFSYGAPSWVLTDTTEKFMQGKFTRMLKYAMGYEATAHMTLPEIYEFIPSIKSIVVSQRMTMLGSTYRQHYKTPQVMCRVLNNLGNKLVA